MPAKRLRIFAGPNGSGKSELYNYLIQQNYFHPYYYINPDEICRQLLSGFSVQLWPVTIQKENFFTFLIESSINSNVTNGKIITETDLDTRVLVNNSIFSCTEELAQEKKELLASIIADYLRKLMLKSDSTFACETVMSHHSKLDFLRNAKSNGYHIYLYFIATKNPVINEERVRNRVEDGGHDVPVDKIRSRYAKTMDNLYDAIMLSDKAWIFDNSESMESRSYKNFAIYNASLNEISFLEQTIPNWFKEYFIDKI